jgi:hypothetical protein
MVDCCCSKIPEKASVYVAVVLALMAILRAVAVE